MDEKDKIRTTFLSEILKERRYMGDMGLDGRIMPKIDLKEILWATLGNAAMKLRTP
jgi:hypothetical protein